jgi:carbon monoxide dehydrogenase subunit G
MASIHREIVVKAPVAQVWDAMRDVGAIHRRLVPGFVTDCRMEGDARVVTFANGLTARELIVDVDDAQRRVVWSARSERLAHHNASLQAFDEGGATRLVWIADLLPNEMAPAIAGMIEHGLAAMQRTLEAA